MEWVKIFKGLEEGISRIPEKKPQLVVVGSVRICLIRFNNNFVAIQDACSHNGESLSKGQLNYLGEIICPWHNYCFDTRSGAEINGRSAALRTYPVKIDESGFFIGI